VVVRQFVRIGVGRVDVNVGVVEMPNLLQAPVAHLSRPRDVRRAPQHQFRSRWIQPELYYDDVARTLLPPDTLERVGTALADPTRRRILIRLLDGPAFPAELADTLGTGRTNISNHLTCLRGGGLVRTTRLGRQVRYELSSRELSRALSVLTKLELDIECHHEDLDGRV
jgi:DNA-binding transcriptional ArsR family regulator